ncbi:MAG: prephenate dehydratase [Mycobacteriales bacterium]
MPKAASTATTRFAYLGPEGTFTEQALRTLPAAAKGTLLPAATILETLDLVRSGGADAGLVPLENSVEGSVAVTLDALAAGEPLLITREVLLPVTFCLAANAEVALAEVRTVGAFPVTEAQCRGWLRTHLPSAEVVTTVRSNADAAVRAAAGEFDAVLTAPLAADRHRLVQLAKEVGDYPDAVTRFVLVTGPGPLPARTGYDRTSLVAFIADNHAGALMEVLTEFAVRGINLTRIESRPTKERLGQYCFLLDCEGHVADARVGEALAGLRRICADVRFLGSYPRAGADSAPPRKGRTDADFAGSAAWLARIRQGHVD